ncbi:26 proteasome complex subunit Sem1 [Blumeria hordei DH14]|uniref:26S proteasome complex subunit SEM1 n=1 Tax=Blumeria graminis f. sp. hordei (strain DH14) TaxID=546991 RepID=N1JI83_BLUG1|nr:26 proteasome complex subunit Sem1 [Blumeria hordei DH14]
MSALPSSKNTPAPSKAITQEKSEIPKEPKPAAAVLEEDDEFEDFPVENWGPEETEPSSNTYLWDESWDDDDVCEDFSAQLKEELKKVETNKKS